jgi:hypothetical protein
VGDRADRDDHDCFADDDDHRTVQPHSLTPVALTSNSPESDLAAVTARLGRPPNARFDVVVRDPDGAPMVIANDPFLTDGTPMPTRYWLVDPTLNRLVSQLENEGGVRAAEAEIDESVLRDAHLAYERERDGLIAADHTGPRPSGGVGGTRVGVKCLHAHYAAYLAGTGDPVGAWVSGQLEARATAASEEDA